MSLINQMLTDLERRQSATAATGGGLLADLGAVETRLPGESVSLHWFVLPLLVGFAVVFAAYFTPQERRSMSAAGAHEYATELTAEPPARGAVVVARTGAVERDAEPLPAETDSDTQSGPSVAHERPPVITVAAARSSVTLMLSDSLSTPAASDVTGSGLGTELLAEAARLNTLMAEHPSAAAPPAASELDTPMPPVADRRLLIERQAAPATPAEQAQARYRKGVALIQRGEIAAGEALLYQVLELLPVHVQAREQLAVRLVRLGHLDAASAMLAEGLQAVPGERRFAKLLGRILAEQNRVAQALRVLAGATPKVDEDPEYHALQAALLQRAGDHARAVETYRAILGVRSGNGIWWMGLGISLEAIGESASALEAFRNALAAGGLTTVVRKYVDGRISAL